VIRDCIGRSARSEIFEVLLYRVTADEGGPATSQYDGIGPPHSQSAR
jgi:hypothetical protein